jgi:serine/threonine-protein kinase
VPEPERRRTTLVDEMHVDMLTREFASAVARARELSAAVESDKTQAVHALPARALVEVYTETGQPDRAAAIAQDFMSRRDAWLPDAFVEDFAIANDPTVPMLQAERLGGRIGDGPLRAQRDAWSAALLSTVEPGYRGYVWIHGYAGTAATREDAVEAIAAAPRFAPLPALALKTIADGSLGHVYLLADRIDDALPYLQRASRTCLAVEHPSSHTRALIDLAAALEAKGDTQGACAADAAVLTRWGKAKPRSVTADRARTQAKALGCTP